MKPTLTEAIGSPTVHYIVSALGERIRSGVYQSGQRLPSERALAEEFGVSRMLIRQVVRELEHQDLVTCAARYRPLVRGGGTVNREILIPARRRSVALWIWPHLHWPASSLIMRGIRQTLGHEDFRLIFESAAGDRWQEMLEAETHFLESVTQDSDVEGVILWHLGGRASLPSLQAIRAAKLPMVFLDRRPPAGFEADYVGVDNKRAAEQSVQHLIAQGHRRIAHVTNLDSASTVQERLAGYKQALERANIPESAELIQKDFGSSSDSPEESSEALLDRLLSLPEPPTALFAVNDLVALHMIAALRGRGLRVPEDMAVAGFDGVEQWKPGLPFLTTVQQPFERMGTQAANLLLSRLEAGPLAPYKHVILDAVLTEGSSTQYTPITPAAQKPKAE